MSSCGSIWTRTLQITRSPLPQTIAGVVDAKTVTTTLVSTSAIPEFPWIQRGVDIQCQQSHVAVDTSSRNGISTIAPAPNHDSEREEFSRRAVIHLINNYCFRFSERHPEVRSMTVRRHQIASRACRSANCVSEAVIDYLVQQEVPKTVVSEIVRPSPEAASSSVSVLLWQLRLPEYVLTPQETW